MLITRQQQPKSRRASYFRRVQCTPHSWSKGERQIRASARAINSDGQALIAHACASADATWALAALAYARLRRAERRESHIQIGQGRRALAWACGMPSAPPWIGRKEAETRGEGATTVRRRARAGERKGGSHLLQHATTRRAARVAHRNRAGAARARVGVRHTKRAAVNRPYGSRNSK